MDKIIPLAILVVCVIVVIVCQVQIFVSTRANIREFASFFPDINFLDLKRATVTPYILNSKARLWEYVLRFMKDDPAVVSPDDADDSSDLENQTVSLIVSSDKGHIHFNKMIAKTNMYLCKNVGTNADYGLLQDICDRDINILDDQIHNSLNAPLYIGLAGTFVGIIIGLLGIDIDGFISGNSDSVQHLLWGIGIAMLASLNGLCLTVANSVYGYKNAAIINDEHKEQYFDFLRRELMPVLSHSMASSLSSLKSVLGHFVDRFGRNLDAYADSAQLLNDNLEKQHLVLTEINKLSLARTATKIAETFVGLKDAADELVVFRTYQENLNATIENVNRMLQEITGIIAKFDDFNTNLSVIVQNQATAVELQKELLIIDYRQEKEGWAGQTPPAAPEFFPAGNMDSDRSKGHRAAPPLPSVWNLQASLYPMPPVLSIAVGRLAAFLFSLLLISLQRPLPGTAPVLHAGLWVITHALLPFLQPF